jgi:hypothetical protein
MSRRLGRDPATGGVAMGANSFDAQQVLNLTVWSLNFGSTSVNDFDDEIAARFLKLTIQSFKFWPAASLLRHG